MLGRQRRPDRRSGSRPRGQLRTLRRGSSQRCPAAPRGLRHESAAASRDRRRGGTDQPPPARDRRRRARRPALLGPAGAVVTPVTRRAPRGSWSGSSGPSLPSRHGRRRGVTLREAQHATGSWDVGLTRPAHPVVDVVLTHDPALAPLGAVRTNEYYVTQYFDSPRSPPAHGTAVAVRQNMPGRGSRGCWSARCGAARVVDRRPPGRRAHGEVRWAGLDRRSCRRPPPAPALARRPAGRAGDLAPAATHRTGFVGVVVADHPAATCADDARWAGSPPPSPSAPPPRRPGATAPRRADGVRRAPTFGSRR